MFPRTPSGSGPDGYSRLVKVPIVLASASPRRLELLRRVGLSPDVRPTSTDESLREGEDPFDAAERLARAKAEAALPGVAPGTLVVAADTLVVLDGKALGKPRDRDDARAMLRALSGRTHGVVTGVALARDGRVVSGRDVTEVVFAPLSDAGIEAYVATGEPDDKAGAYALQGIGGLFVERIDGTPSNVVGLPVRLVALLAHRLGVDLLG